MGKHSGNAGRGKCEAWEQQQNESQRAHAAFVDYCRMGAARSLRGLLERYGQQIASNEQAKPPTVQWSTLCGGSAKFDGQARVALWDAEQQRLAEESYRLLWHQRTRGQRTGRKSLKSTSVKRPSACPFQRAVSVTARPQSSRWSPLRASGGTAHTRRTRRCGRGSRRSGDGRDPPLSSGRVPSKRGKPREAQRPATIRLRRN